MKKILAIHTGGTISMSLSKQGAVHNYVNPIAHHHLTLNGRIRLVNRVVANVSSQMMTISMLFHIRQIIMQARHAGFTGAVVTHGTDTLEESAYFLELTLPHDFPVVVTGAMRSSNEIGSDGLRNFKEALMVVADPRAQRLGTLVVFNDEIDAARYVTKTHSTNVSTFKSPLTGPVGVISNRRLYFFRRSVTDQVLNIKHAGAKVYLLKTYLGMNGLLFDAVNRPSTDGLVIEGVGAGNVPPQTLLSIHSLLEKRVPVVVVSRCLNGFAEDLYNDRGGCYGLQKAGVTICRGLNGQKARIKMIVGISYGLEGRALREYMQSSK